MPVTIYVATGQIESGRPFWFDRVMNALQAPGPVEIDLRDAGLRRWTLGPARPGGADAARWGVVSDILETLKTVDPARRETLADAIAARAPRPDRPPPPLAPMTPEEVAELARCEGVTIGAHSHGHELLDQVPEARARASIARSRALLEAWTGRPVRHFAYPNGNLSPAVARAPTRSRCPESPSAAMTASPASGCGWRGSERGGAGGSGPASGPGIGAGSGGVGT